MHSGTLGLVVRLRTTDSGGCAGGLGNLELTQEFGPTAFSVSSERHGQSGVNKLPKLRKGGGGIEPPSSRSTGGCSNH